MDGDELLIDVYGVCMVALLLRTSRAVQFEPEDKIANFLHDDKKFPQTGFVDAMSGANLDLSHIKLKCEKFDSQAKKSNVTIYNDTGSSGEWSDLFARYKNLRLFQAGSCVDLELHANDKRNHRSYWPVS